TVSSPRTLCKVLNAEWGRLALEVRLARSRTELPTEMKIATWNINGIRARLDGTVQWVREAAPDIICFQEIKSEDASFPHHVFEDLGYNIVINGQKGFNGVALLSKLKFDEVSRGLPGLHDDQARFIEAVFSLPGSAIRIASLYFPNGNPPASD